MVIVATASCCAQILQKLYNCSMGILSRKEHPPMRSNNRELAATALMAAVTAALAWVVIPLPFTPVPVSGQTVGVMLAGLFLPPQLAALSQVIYIALGVLGLPVLRAAAWA